MSPIREGAFNDLYGPRGALMGHQTAFSGNLGMDCSSQYHLLKSQHCSFCSSDCFNQPLASYLPTHPIDVIYDTTGITSKTRSI